MKSREDRLEFAVRTLIGWLVGLGVLLAGLMWRWG
jgi:hypothetical protein